MSRVRPGSYRTLASLQRRTVARTGTLGTPTYTWAEYATAYVATMSPQAGSERTEGDAQQARRSVTLETHYRSDILVTDRVVMDGRTLDVEGVENAEMRNRVTRLTCREAV